MSLNFLIKLIFAWTGCILFHTAICGLSLSLGLEHFGLGLGLGLGTAGLDYKSGKNVISDSPMHCLLLFRALSIDKNADDDQWCGLRPSVLGQDRSQTKKSVLVLVLVLKFWCCVAKHGLVTLVVIMILKDTATFQLLFIVFFLFCAWNITTVDINSGVYLLNH